MPVDCTAKLATAQTSVLSYLVKLNNAIDADHQDLVQALANRFCDQLIDYVSYAEYRVLPRRSIPDYHHAAIGRITQEVLRFNDLYGTSQTIDVPCLKADLENLALALETRLGIEDELAFEQAAITA